jgi:hypothetical protein
MGASRERERSEPIAIEGVQHAPENEAGVILLFAKLHKKIGFPIIDRIQDRFPDCYAYLRTANGTRRIWIEFEYRSNAFKRHLSQLKGVRPKKGFVVCWHHDWLGCERHVKVIELRTCIGLGRRVWLQSTRPKYQWGLDQTPYRRRNRMEWTVSGRARPGDLVLMWRAGTTAEAKKYEADEDLLHSFANIFEVTTRPWRDRRWGWQADVRQLALLRNPLRLGALRADRILSRTPWMKFSLRGRWDVTPYWWRLSELIVRLNPELKKNKRFQAASLEII